MINEIKTFEERKQELLEIGLKNKKVTFEEIAEKLKGIEPDSDLLDDLYNMFVQNGIEVVGADVENINEEEDEEEDSGSDFLDSVVSNKDIKIKTCKNCGKYFIPIKNTEKYCDITYYENENKEGSNHEEKTGHDFGSCAACGADLGG